MTSRPGASRASATTLPPRGSLRSSTTATAPQLRPTMAAMATLPREISQASRKPTSSRANTSRPTASVPSKCVSDGPIPACCSSNIVVLPVSNEPARASTGATNVTSAATPSTVPSTDPSGVDDGSGTSSQSPNAPASAPHQLSHQRDNQQSGRGCGHRGDIQPDQRLDEQVANAWLAHQRLQNHQCSGAGREALADGTDAGQRARQPRAPPPAFADRDRDQDRDSTAKAEREDRHPACAGGPCRTRDDQRSERHRQWYGRCPQHAQQPADTAGDPARRRRQHGPQAGHAVPDQSTHHQRQRQDEQAGAEPGIDQLLHRLMGDDRVTRARRAPTADCGRCGGQRQRPPDQDAQPTPGPARQLPVPTR